MIVDTTEESRRSVFTDVPGDEVTATGMFVDECGYVVDESGDKDERAFRSLFLD